MHGRGRLCACLIATAVLTVVLAPSPGSAQIGVITAIVIGFDDLADGTEITTQQYQSQGVKFSASASGSFPVAAQVPAGEAQSGANVAKTACDSAAAECEFFLPQIKGAFTEFHKRISVYVGRLVRIGYDPISVVELRAFDVAGNPVGSTASATVAAGAGFHTELVVISDSFNIASFEVVAPAGVDRGQPIGIDNLTFDVPPGPSQPDFSLEPLTAQTLRQGATTTQTITVNRFNESSGDISFAVSGLPPGVTAQVSPNPISTIATSATLTFSAASDAPVTATNTPVTLTATPLVPAAGPIARARQLHLSVASNFHVLVEKSPVEVPTCSAGSATVSVVRTPGFTNPVDLAITGLPPGVHGTFSPPTVTHPTDGSFVSSSTLALSIPGSIPLQDGVGTVTARSGVLPAANASITVRPTLGVVTGFSPEFARAPADLQPGTTVTVDGVGFCPGSIVEFGHPYARAVPESISSDGRQLAARVPRLATSGPVTVVTPAGARLTSSATLTVRSFRNSGGFSFENYPWAGFGFFPPDEFSKGLDRLSEVFGAKQIFFSLNPCWPLDCTVVSPVVKPGVLILMAIANATLADGSCFGMVFTTQQLASGHVGYGRFPPVPAANAWTLQAPGAPSVPLAHHIRTYHVAQFGAEWLHEILAGVAQSLRADGPALVRAKIRGLLEQHKHPLIAIRSKSGGHVVIAYDLRPMTGSGDYVIDVYDPNLPFLSGENGDGLIHELREQKSSIHVQADGDWTYEGAFDSPWTGGRTAMVPVDYTSLPQRQTMLDSFEGLGTLVFGAATATQVADAQGRRLLDARGMLNTDPRTSIPEATVFAGLVGSRQTAERPALFLLGRSGEYTQTVRGERGGDYGAVALGRRFAARLTGVPSARDENDRITFDAKEGSLGFTTDAAHKTFTAELAVKARDGSDYQAEITTMSGKGGSVSFTLDRAGQSFNYRHRGASARYRLRLSWAGTKGVPGSFVSPPLTIHSGERASFKPRNWRKLLGSRVELRLTDAKGVRTKRMLANRARLPGRITISSVRAVKAASGRRRLEIKTFARALPRGATGYVNWIVSSGGRVVGKKQLRLSAAALRGTRTHRWLFAPRRAGRHLLRASLSIVTVRPILAMETRAMKIGFSA